MSNTNNADTMPVASATVHDGDVVEVIGERAALDGDAPGGLFAQLGGILPMVLIFAVFYFFVLRPQEKKKKEHDEFVGSVKKGESVVTTSGIYGTVLKVNDADNTVDLEIAEKVVVKVLKSAVLDIISRKKEQKTSDKQAEKSDKSAKPSSKKK